jgi:cytochrome b5
MKPINALTLIYFDRGGEEVLMDVAGQDSTDAFEDVGHSDEAREILNGLLVGKLKRQVWNLNSSHPLVLLSSLCFSV